jgi:hypothetical protein
MKPILVLLTVTRSSSCEALLRIRLATSFDMRVSCKHRYGLILNPEESSICSVFSLARGKAIANPNMLQFETHRLNALAKKLYSAVGWVFYLRMISALPVYVIISFYSIRYLQHEQRLLLQICSVRKRCCTRIEPHLPLS